MPPVMFSVITKYHKGRHSLFLYNSEIFYAFTQDILRSLFFIKVFKRLFQQANRLENQVDVQGYAPILKFGTKIIRFCVIMIKIRIGVFL